MISGFLENLYEEVDYQSFYRDLFPEGSFEQAGVYESGMYNGIALAVTPGDRKKVRRYTVTDDLEVIDELVEYLRQLHVKRMTRKQCNVYAGIEYQNILLHLERLSDQCSDLAVYMLGRTNDSINGNEHQYIHDLHHSDNKEYQEAFNANYSKYFGPLQEMAQQS